MKRFLLPAGALVLLALLLGGCTMDGERIVVTDPPRVTSNVTSSPAPAAPEVTPEPPGAGSEPDRGSGLTSGSGLDQSSSTGKDHSSGTAGTDRPGGTGAKHSAAPGVSGK